MRPLALVALGDELRREAGGVLEALAAQGIQFKILSGDNAETVRATIGQLGLPLANDPVVSGDQLSATPTPEQLIREHSVFGRIGPQQKLQIVEWLHAEAHHVAMIGDGINDILPIKRADLGIAMGSGSSATKTVAGLVLETDDFALLPATLDEGRTILRNLRRASKLFLLKNVYTLFLVVIAYVLLGRDFPYNPQRVTLLNALTIGVPAFFIMLGRGSSVTSARTGFLREVGWFAISTGVITGASALGVYLIAAGLYDDHEIHRTMLLSVLVLLGLANVVRLSEGDRRLLAWTLAALPIYAVVMYLPAVGRLDNGVELSLRYYFELRPLSVAQWALVVLCAAPALGVCLGIDRIKALMAARFHTPLPLR
jgi:cation-transporting ATPase E